MEYAIIKTGGKQYKVSSGSTIVVEKLAEDKSVVFADVLLHAVDGKVSVGAPYVAGVSVHGSVVENVKGPKIRVVKYKSKSRYSRFTGHRQKLTNVHIDRKPVFCPCFIERGFFVVRIKIS